MEESRSERAVLATTRWSQRHQRAITWISVVVIVLTWVGFLAFLAVMVGEGVPVWAAVVCVILIGSYTVWRLRVWRRWREGESLAR